MLDFKFIHLNLNSITNLIPHKILYILQAAHFIFATHAFIIIITYSKCSLFHSEFS